ncbi:hypothetical protein BGZ58_003912 [Dissophora ornata]|nr:hypothetical protein BGZ58_003912 [Dissophora ornata]
MFLDKIKHKFDLSLIKNIELEDMAIDFTGPDDWTSTLSSDHMIAHISNIPGFSWPIQQIQMRDNDIDLGRLDTPYSPARVSGGIISTSFAHSTMSIYESSRMAFSEFLAALATKTHHTFTVKASTDIIFHLGLLGTHTIHSIDFVSDMTLRGLNNLPDIKCLSIKDVSFGHGGDGAGNAEGGADRGKEGEGVKRQELFIKGMFDIQNPSQLSLMLGDVTLGLAYTAKTAIDAGESGGSTERLPIGTLMLENLALLQGLNDCRIGTIRLDLTLDGTKQFLKDVAQGPQTVHVHGFDGTSRNEALVGALHGLATSFIMPTFAAPELVPPPKIEQQ